MKLLLAALASASSAPPALDVTINSNSGDFIAAYKDESNYNLAMNPPLGISIDLNERPFAGVCSGYFSSASGTIGSYGIIIDNPILALGTSDFCVELWAKSLNTLNTSAGLFSGSTIAGANGVAIARDQQWIGNNTTYLFTSASITHPFGWSHIAFTRSGTTIRLYINGVEVQAATTTGTTINLNATKYAIAHRYVDGTVSTSAVWQGWLTNIRMVKGYSVYSGNFTTPTAPVLQSGALSASAYSSTTNVNTTFPSSACVFLTNFRALTAPITDSGVNKISLSTNVVYDLTTRQSKPVYFKIWGAGGGSSPAANSGGRGGYVEGFIQLQKDTTYKVVVGGPGQTGYTSTGVAGGSPGGGGFCGRGNGDYRGSGGGYSGVFLGTETHANSLLIAGGGGGGESPAGGGGGNGGGLIGGTGPHQYNGGPGGGGTQTAGGAAGTYVNYFSGSTAGSALAGGQGASTLTTSLTGGGGGGGYYGGGGGGGNNTAGGNGGGGSGYIHPTLVSHGEFFQPLSSDLGQQVKYGGAVPNSSDADYISPAGTQAAGNTQGVFAGGGLVVMRDGYLIHNITASDVLAPNTTISFTAHTLSPTVTWSSPNLYGGITLTSEGVMTVPNDIALGTVTVVATNFRGQSLSKDFTTGPALSYVKFIYPEPYGNRAYLSSVIPDGANYESVWSGEVRPTRWGYFFLTTTTLNQSDYYPIGSNTGSIPNAVEFTHYSSGQLARAHDPYQYIEYFNSNLYLGFRMSRSGNTVTLQSFNPSTNTTIFTRTTNISANPDTTKFMFLTASDYAATSGYQINLVSSTWPLGFFLQQYETS